MCVRQCGGGLVFIIRGYREEKGLNTPLHTHTLTSWGVLLSPPLHPSFWVPSKEPHLKAAGRRTPLVLDALLGFSTGRGYVALDTSVG